MHRSRRGFLGLLAVAPVAAPAAAVAAQRRHAGMAAQAMSDAWARPMKVTDVAGSARVEIHVGRFAIGGAPRAPAGTMAAADPAEAGKLPA